MRPLGNFRASFGPSYFGTRPLLLLGGVLANPDVYFSGGLQSPHVLWSAG